MEVFGKEIKFRRTVGATCEIAEVCPNGDIRKIDEAMKESYEKEILVMATVVSALNEGYEKYTAYEAKHNGTAYRAEWITVDECMLLDFDVLTELFYEAAQIFRKDAKRTVKAKSKPSKKGPAEAPESD